MRCNLKIYKEKPMYDSGDFYENEEEEEGETMKLKRARKWVRSGSVIKLLEYYYFPPNPNIANSVVKTLWRIDLMVFIQIPFILLIIAFVIFIYTQRYQACMDIFNSIWYCALR